jgi:hypothetical protein
MLSPLPLRFCNLLAIGCGEVVKNRVRPAAHHLRREVGLERIAYLDLYPTSPIELAPDEYYFAVESDPSCRLLDTLSRHRFLGPDTLAVVCTPTIWHAHYADKFAPLVGRLAVEKPLTCDLAEAQRLSIKHPHIHPISHFLFKDEMRDWLAECRLDGLPWLSACTGITIDLTEKQGIGLRQVDPMIYDLGWHAWELLQAPFRAAGWITEVELSAVNVATYEPPITEPAPTDTTAACITGNLRVGGMGVPFQIRLGKGLSHDRKALKYTFEGGHKRTIDLSQGGWRSHHALLHELLTTEDPDMGIDLTDAVEVVRLCVCSEAQAIDEGTYLFGETPMFLGEERQEASLLGLYW